MIIYLTELLRKQHGVERSDSGGDPGLGPGNQVTEGHEHGVRKHEQGVRKHVCLGRTFTFYTHLRTQNNYNIHYAFYTNVTPACV